MQCELIREMEVWEPTAPAELVDQCERRGGALFAPAGTIVTDPGCWQLVAFGHAKPTDDECKAKVAVPDDDVDCTDAFLTSKGIDGGIKGLLALPGVTDREIISRKDARFAIQEFALLRQDRAIDPNDWPAYARGELIGYEQDKNGNWRWIPGPNGKPAGEPEDTGDPLLDEE